MVRILKFARESCGNTTILFECTQDNGFCSSCIIVLIMAEAKTKEPEDASGVCTFKFDEKTTERISDGKRKLLFKNFGSLSPAPRMLIFKKARGLDFLDFLLPAVAGISFSTSVTTHVEYSGSLADLEVDFVWSGWKPGTEVSWHVEPLSGWSFELSVEYKH
jgi:hypothetical protein